MTNKLCLTCGTLTPRTRCPACQTIIDRNRNRRRLQYQATWYATSRRARKAQPWCSACGATNDLTLDHETGQVQCRPCNSAHQGTTIPTRWGRGV